MLTQVLERCFDQLLHSGNVLQLIPEKKRELRKKQNFMSGARAVDRFSQALPKGFKIFDWFAHNSTGIVTHPRKRALLDRIGRPA